jgi:hypothetical protein
MNFSSRFCDALLVCALMAAFVILLRVDEGGPDAIYAKFLLILWSVAFVAVIRRFRKNSK